MKKEFVLHLRRHLAAREPLFIGKEIPVPGTNDKALVGNGLHPDKEAHLQPGEYQKAVDIGKTLYLPEGVQSVFIAPSPLDRAVETANYLFVGMAEAFARQVLKVDPAKISEQDKKTLSEKGLHRLAEFRLFEGLLETNYKNYVGNYDDGNELVAEAYHKGVNPTFAGYRWMVQKGFENDPRSEHPRDIAARGLSLLRLTRADCSLSASHQPNLEIITAALTGNLGKDANELFERAGGDYVMGGGFELRIYQTDDLVQEASLKRTLKDPKVLEKELTVDMDTLRKYL